MSKGKDYPGPGQLRATSYAIEYMHESTHGSWMWAGETADTLGEAMEILRVIVTSDAELGSEGMSYRVAEVTRRVITPSAPGELLLKAFDLVNAHPESEDR